jgi:hypothetical protein
VGALDSFVSFLGDWNAFQEKHVYVLRSVGELLVLVHRWMKVSEAQGIQGSKNT